MKKYWCKKAAALHVGKNNPTLKVEHTYIKEKKNIKYAQDSYNFFSHYTPRAQQAAAERLVRCEPRGSVWGWPESAVQRGLVRALALPSTM